MKTPIPDSGRRAVEITDPREIADIERDDVHDLVGWQDSRGRYFAHVYTVSAYRRRRAVEEADE